MIDQMSIAVQEPPQGESYCRMILKAHETVFENIGKNSFTKN